MVLQMLCQPSCQMLVCLDKGNQHLNLADGEDMDGLLTILYKKQNCSLDLIFVLLYMPKVQPNNLRFYDKSY